MIGRRTVLCLALSQLICWGTSFYLVGVFGQAIAADLGWSRAHVHGGFSVALLTMGIASPLVGWLIDRVGGGKVMAIGSVLCAAGCIGLAATRTSAAYYAAWICLGLAMRATLYDAAFAALARIGGPTARRPIAQVTLLGGLASTVFWPVGHTLMQAVGWRGGLLVYAALALLTVPLHLAVPAGRYRCDTPPERTRVGPSDRARRWSPAVAAMLYAVLVMLTNGLSAAMAAHMIGMLTELGLAAASAVSVAALHGIGQSSARLAEVLSGGRLHPVTLNLLATLVLPLCFAAGLAAGCSLTAAAAFTFLYGAGNGILSITRGTLPLVLFDLRSYGAFVGTLLVPGFVAAAAAPLVFAAAIDRFGADGALHLSIALSSVMLCAAVALRHLRCS